MFDDSSRKEELERRKAALIARKLQRESQELDQEQALTLSSSLPEHQTIIEKPVRKTRRSVATQNSDVEFSNTRKRARKKAPAKIRYLKSTSSIKGISMTPAKLGWLVCFGLFLRLIFMDNGVVDYYSMENHMKDKLHGLEMLRDENARLITEIHRIKTDSSYQKKLAREHLGVIAKDEYLILFAQESNHSSI